MSKENRSNNENVAAIENEVMAFVDNKFALQKLRIQIGNRICAYFKTCMGQEPGKSEKELKKEQQDLLRKLRKEYKLITDALIDNKVTVNKQINELVDTDKITMIDSIRKFDLIDEYEQLKGLEEKNVKNLTKAVKEHPLYSAFFDTEQCRGIGPETAAACISLFDIHKARHASCFWKYAGLNPVRRVDKDGNEILEANSKKYTEMVKYIDKDGKEKEKKSITYNPKLKTILLGVTGSNILKACIRKDKETGDIIAKGYAIQYMDYKIRKHNEHPEWTMARCHAVANRWMIRNFVRDLWVAWRRIEGLPITIPYEQEYLGKAPHKWDNEVIYPGQANLMDDGGED